MEEMTEAEALSVVTRACKKCGETKDLDLFKPNKRCLLGREHTCKQCFLSFQKNWAKENPQKISASFKRYLETNLDKHKQVCKTWRDKNKELRRGYTADYKALKRRACPVWANKTEIKLFYMKCPQDHHVDHIIPLKGKIVCGLHVTANLQYLPAKMNLQKGNTYDPT